ncbi:hypothetical protein CKO_01566 [Citrobacter koseri ATCC BAA-895]|uniref:Uncharacterized protein n=1 Tax=Citrobacter koseri (strain ATCC BAA-895 / CDC 4225-83 / SGSC4696) TaxID=290338 RepID=A8AGT6_CITK8|nr:hypothetical protein CKO_01566 [Citrobacter koseri ATCC BAA-895]
MSANKDTQSIWCLIFIVRISSDSQTQQVFSQTKRKAEENTNT